MDGLFGSETHEQTPRFFRYIHGNLFFFQSMKKQRPETITNIVDQIFGKRHHPSEPGRYPMLSTKFLVSAKPLNMIELT